jgi:predicted nucleic acid-binding protein
MSNHPRFVLIVAGTRSPLFGAFSRNLIRGSSQVRILPATREIADIFGIIKHRLIKAGTPIPMNDVRIASHAAESGSHLVTFDAHFAQVPGLLLWGGER